MSSGGPVRVPVLRNRNARAVWFDAAAREIGLPGLTPHELRHTAASLAISAGAHVEVVQRMLGHASAAMTLDRCAACSTTTWMTWTRWPTGWTPCGAARADRSCSGGSGRPPA